MDLIEKLLGGRGCSTDGSLTRNPITSMVDSVFNSHIASSQHQLPASFGEEQGYFMEESIRQQSGTVNSVSQFPNDALMAGYQGMENHASSMSNQMLGGPQMWQQQQYMMMQQQAAMSQMMQMQHHRAMMEQNSSYKNSAVEDRSIERDDYQDDYTADNRGFEKNIGYQREVNFVADPEFVVPQSSTDELGKALEKALNEGELTSHRMDEIWSSFGAELTENNPAYTASDAVDWSTERNRQEEAYAHHTDTAEIKNDGQSLEGYRKAWESLSEKLEAGKDDYAFTPNNKYVTDSKGFPGDLFEEGMKLFKEAKIREAVLAFEAEAQRDSGNSEAWRMLGVCHSENDEDKKAIISLRRSLDEDPYNLDSLLALGTSYVNEVDSVRALECLSSWVSHNPLFQGLKVSADEYSDGSQIDDVMQLMLAVAAHSPSNPEVQVVLGVLYNISQDFDSAIDCFRHAIELSPPDYSLLNKDFTSMADNFTATLLHNCITNVQRFLPHCHLMQLGATLANNNKSEQAIQVYARALNARPTYARGWLNLGISFANMSQYEEAAKAYVQALHLTPSARHIWGYLRVVFTSMNRMDLSEVSSSENTQTIADKLGITLIHPQ